MLLYAICWLVEERGESQNGLEKSAGKENSQEMRRKTHQSPTKSDVGRPNLQTLSFSVSWL